MSAKLIMTKGLPGSGKSTWAEGIRQLSNPMFKSQWGNTPTVIVCKDDIRASLKKTWSYDVEKEVLRIRDFKISAALSKGFMVISSDTNLAPKHEARLRELAAKFKVPFEVKDFTHVPIATCIERDAGREASVGAKVIVKMAEDHLDCSRLIDRSAVDEPQLFLDLDGVFADFDGFILETFGLPRTPRGEAERPDFWDIMRTYPGRFYYDGIKRMPHALELWDALKHFKPIILTGVPWSIPGALQNKQQWVSENIDPDVQVVGASSRNKRCFARPGDILVDDSPHHAPRWQEKGCIWITYTGDNPDTITKVNEAMKGS